MNTAIARLSALTIVGLLTISIVVVALTSSKEVRGTEVRAEFVDGWPLLEGMSVRMSGGVVGKVNRVELSTHGTAVVTMDLHEGLPPLRADASVAVRQQDLLGDSYLSLSPGDAAEPLDETIPTARTIARPRLDDVVGMVTPQVREGVQVLALELGTALERRGGDLNEAILRLRPGFQATDRLLAEFRGQNRALEQALSNARAVTSQGAAHTKEIDQTIRDLAATTETVAAAEPAVAELLAGAPATMARAERSLRSLRGVLEEAKPVADELERGSTRWVALVDGLAEFPKSAKPTLRLLTEFVGRLRRAMNAGAPAFSQLAGADLGLLGPAGIGLDRLSLVLDDFLSALVGSPDGKGGLFGFKPRRDRWPTDPKSDPARSYLPVAMNLNCELFGVPVEPGCLEKSGRTESDIPTELSTRAKKPKRDPQRDAVLDYLLGP